MNWRKETQEEKKSERSYSVIQSIHLSLRCLISVMLHRGEARRQHENQEKRYRIPI